MRLFNRRIQYAVGQGGFHAGKLEVDGKLDLRYVVDCGAMSAYAKRRNQCVDEYLDKEGERSVLDILFITHAHADHVNGVERLLDPVSGMQVKAIVMPLLSVVERLLCFAKTTDEDPRGASNRFYRDFTVDPVTAVSRFRPDQIILVESSGPDNGAPFSRDGDGLNPNQPDLKVWPEKNDSRSWKAVGKGVARSVGRGAARALPADTGAGKSKSDRAAQLASVIPDSVGFEYAVGADLKWLLAPYVDPGIKAETRAFLKALASQLGLSATELLDWLDDLRNVKTLVTKDVAKLVAAYKTLEKDLNVTSLIVYSGPTHGGCPRHIRIHHTRVRAGGRRAWHNDDGRVGWLGTGDAALKEKKRRDAFFNHYRRLLDLVHTFTLPHHGSEGNFDDSLLARIKPRHCVAAADHVRNWRHPGSTVVQSVASSGAILSVVTSAEVAQIEEAVFVG